MTEGLPRATGFLPRLPYTTQYSLIREVGDRPIDLTRLEDAVVPGGTVDIGRSFPNPEAPKIPKLDS
jgi:hypothetical protein